MDKDHKQLVAFALVIIGLLATGIGCWRHFAELTTAAVGVAGGGLGMLKGSDSKDSGTSPKD